MCVGAIGLKSVDMEVNSHNAYHTPYVIGALLLLGPGVGGAVRPANAEELDLKAQLATLSKQVMLCVGLGGHGEWVGGVVCIVDGGWYM